VVAGAAAGAAACRDPRLSGDGALSTPEEFAEFLSHQAPFDEADESERLAAASAATLFELYKGQPALIEDGEPSPGIFVVVTGSVELVHDGQVVDVLEPGECFGHPSLLSGLAPAFTVRAREPSSVLLIPREEAMQVLGHRAGAAFVASSLRERLVRSSDTAQALPDLGMSRLRSLVHRQPLVLEPEVSLRDAARRMSEEHVSAALVGLPDGPALLTDAGLRERALAEGRSAEDPVRLVAAPDPLTAPGDRTVGEALVDLLEAESRDLCVTDEGDGSIIGILGIEDLAGGEHSPFALRRALLRASDTDALVRVANEGLPRLMSSLLSTGLSPLDVSRALAAQSDAVTLRLIDFAFERHGQAPVAWAWMALGSVARRELTLASDQDNAFAYANPARPEIEEWFGLLAADVNEGLSRCGFGADNAEVLARNPDWRMSEGEWEEVLEACLEHPDRSRLVRAAVTFDFRQVGGGLDLVPPLVDILRRARDHPHFLGRLARTATDWKVALGRRGSLKTDDDGKLDLKHGAILPIANLARFHAVSAGITVSGTLDRLVAAQDSGSLESEAATALRESFIVISRLRMEHHAACMREGRQPDNLLDPDALPPLHRATLREALHEVQAEQKKLSVYAPIGI
jgi:CBS domain-containing protein